MSEILDLGSIIGPSAFKDWCTRQDPVLDPDEASSWLSFLAAIKGDPGPTGSPGADGLTQEQVDARVAIGVAELQDALTFDTAPTAASTNPVTSGGVKTALDTKQDALTFDSTPTAESTNPVTSGGVKDVLDGLSLGDTGWIAMTMNTDKVPTGQIYYRAKNGVLYLAGNVTFSYMFEFTLTSSVIPAAYLPSSTYGSPSWVSDTLYARVKTSTSLSLISDMWIGSDGKIYNFGVLSFSTGKTIANGVTVSLNLDGNSWVI